MLASHGDVASGTVTPEVVSVRDAVCRSLLGTAGAHIVVGPQVDEAASALAALLDTLVARITLDPPVSRPGAPL